MDLKAFMKFLAGAFGALGGIAALFVAFGYITLQSYLSNMKLYGLVSFPLQFYKEASISLLRDLTVFYLDHPASVLIPVGILAAVLLVRAGTGLSSEKLFTGEKLLSLKERSVNLGRTAGMAGLLMIFIVTILPFVAAIRGRLELESVIFNALSVPVLIILALFLAVDFSKLDPLQPLKNFYFWYVIAFAVLFMSIPVVYGFYLYDIPVFTASVPYCSTELTHFGTADGQNSSQEENKLKPKLREYKLLYLMGHTTEREVFFDATRTPTTIIIVDKKLVNSIKIDYSKTQTQRLRTLFGKPSPDLWEQSPDELRKVISGETKILDQAQLDQWMSGEGSPQPKEKKNAQK